MHLQQDAAQSLRRRRRPSQAPRKAAPRKIHPSSATSNSPTAPTPTGSTPPSSTSASRPTWIRISRSSSSANASSASSATCPITPKPGFYSSFSSSSARAFALTSAPSSNAFWLAPFLLGIATLCIYAIVNVEDRYLTARSSSSCSFHSSPQLRISPAPKTLAARTAASAAVVLLALLAVGESARIVGQLRRDLVFIHYPTGWYDHDTFHAAHALNDLGVGPGDTIACIGTRACLYDHYWARLAGVRILTEIYEHRRPALPLPRRPTTIASKPTTSSAAKAPRFSSATSTPAS